MKHYQGSNFTDIKNTNRNLVLKLLCTMPHMSRIELSKMTGLSKMTITNIVSDLIKENYIKESMGLASNTSGPKPIHITISENAPKLFGLAVRRQKVGVVVTTLDFDILFEKYISFDSASAQEVVGFSSALLKEALTLYPNALGIGISSPGPLDKSDGRILAPPNLFSDSAVLPIAEIIRSEFGIPVYLEKDSTASVLAEKLWGKGKTLENFLFLSYSIGLGAGIVVNNDLYQPALSGAGEIGHTTIFADGETCQCGNKGCLELYCSSKIVKNEINAILNTNYSFEECAKRFDEEIIKKVFYDKARLLAAGLLNCVNLFNPSLIILGDEGCDFPDEVIEYIQEYQNKYNFSQTGEIQIVKSLFGHNSSLYGAAAITLGKLFNVLY